jgi:hypothetical protein
MLAQLVDRIDAAHGTRFALGERLASDEQRAYAPTPRAGVGPG